MVNVQQFHVFLAVLNGLKCRKSRAAWAAFTNRCVVYSKQPLDDFLKAFKVIGAINKQMPNDSSAEGARRVLHYAKLRFGVVFPNPKQRLGPGFTGTRFADVPLGSAARFAPCLFAKSCHRHDF